MKKMLNTEFKENILIILFDTKKKTNPFSEQLTNEVITTLKKAEKDDDVHGVVLTGGVDRSFSAGGDFNEVRMLHDGKTVYNWIKGVMNLYITTLEFSKPCVAAIDKHAIGIGFQLALMCDIRVGTRDTVFIMPELKGGIACTIGAYLLEKFLTRTVMQEIIFSSEPIVADKALEWNLLNEKCDKKLLIDTAFNWAKKIADYPVLSFRETKKVVNKELIHNLEAITPSTIMAHIIAIEGNSGQKYYKKILDGEN